MNSQTVLYPGQVPELKRKAGLVLVRGLIWGIAGGFFGVVFLSVLGHLQHASEGVWQVPLAAAVAGAVVGAFYSAKRVANIGAIAGSLTGVGYLISVHPSLPPPLAVLAACGLAGFLIGALTSGAYQSKRGAWLVALAGFLAGGVAGGLAEIAASLANGADRVFVLALVMAPATGILFALANIQFHDKLKAQLPLWLNVGAVAAGIAAVVGIGVWMLSATLSLDLDNAHQGAIASTIGQLPHAFSGGLAGGAVVGALLEFMGVRWLYQV
jgi:hypothetical protein